MNVEQEQQLDEPHLNINMSSDDINSVAFEPFLHADVNDKNNVDQDDISESHVLVNMLSNVGDIGNTYMNHSIMSSGDGW